MTASLHTTNYNLAQYAEGDTLTVLEDFNGNMSKIDSAVFQATTNVNVAVTTANNALSLAQTNEKDIGTLDGEVADLTTQQTVLGNRMTTFETGQAAQDTKIAANSSALEGRAPTNHASTSTVYGVANSLNYGHVQLYDASDATKGQNAGYAATPAAVAGAMAAIISELAEKKTVEPTAPSGWSLNASTKNHVTAFPTLGLLEVSYAITRSSDGALANTVLANLDDLGLGQYKPAAEFSIPNVATLIAAGGSSPVYRHSGMAIKPNGDIYIGSSQTSHGVSVWTGLFSLAELVG